MYGAEGRFPEAQRQEAQQRRRGADWQMNTRQARVHEAEDPPCPCPATGPPPPKAPPPGGKAAVSRIASFLRRRPGFAGSINWDLLPCTKCGWAGGYKFWGNLGPESKMTKEHHDALYEWEGNFYTVRCENCYPPGAKNSYWQGRQERRQVQHSACRVEG